MVIAVNTRFLNGDPEGYGYYIRELFPRICRANPAHQFVFIFDRPTEMPGNLPSNVSSVITGPPARHPLLWKWWYDVKIPSALKKIKADVFVSPDGFCSTRTGVPQVLVIHDLDFVHHPRFNRRSHIYYYRRYTPKCIRNAKKIVTVSEFSKADIIRQYPIAAGKTEVIYNGVDSRFQPASFEQRTTTREKYSGGMEYFLYAGSIHPRKNLVNLLKGFSLFKRRQRSSMKLIICGRIAWRSRPFVELLKTYKYREDVILTGYLPETELASLMSSAYGFVYPSLLEGFGLPVLESMASGVPVMTTTGSAMQEIGKDAALYFDATDPASIADRMMLLYKDEQLRSKLSVEGMEVASVFNWDDAAYRFWKVIESAAEVNP
jgi:glycosyltransferase involved in cell wall biosynthesis